MDGASSLSAGARVVLPADVAFIDPEEQIFAAMLEGWRRQQQSRALRKDTITGRLKVIARFHAFTDRYPWQWTAQDAVDFSADLSGKVALSTLRQYQCAGRLFSEYVTDPRYEWVGECTQRFRAAPIQIWDEWNTAAHTSEFEGLPGRRPLTFEEVQQLFDYADSRFAKIRADRKKGSLSAFRDAVIFKVAYAYGLRRREVCRLDLADFRANPTMKRFGRFGALHVRYGKGVKGSPPRRRVVLTVPQFGWIVDVIEQYLHEIRPQLDPGGHPGLFVSERRGYVTPKRLGERFTQLIRDAKLSDELELHCLRHSYSTHLAEYGYDPLFIQHQLGHTYASTTSIYTHVSSDFKNRQIIKALERLYKKE